ncbi:TetR/AcrR family transcriptional regulator [Oceanidesulfovibrio marinus]|nr:TetR/AcrR family transcriptional regulator [Oceanidesulfovibrio marinus]
MNIDTRKTMLDQALLLFAKRGYEGVGVQEIVAAAGVTKPTLYYHFKSKQGLLSTLLDERLSPVLVHLEEQEPSGDIEPDLTRCAATLFAYAASNPEMYRLFLALMFASPESPQHEIAAVHAERQFRAIERIFVRAVEAGTVEDDAALLAATFQGALHNYITLFLLGHVGLDEGAARGAAHRFVHGIGSPDSGNE